METLTQQDLKQIAEASGDHLISIYIPTESVGDDSQKNPIRFKNQVQKAEAQLEEAGWDTQSVQERLAPAYQLTEDFEYWQQQGEGLAAFLSEEGLVTLRLPTRFDERLTVGAHFDIVPLFELMVQQSHYYVLALSQNQVRLVEVSGAEAAELDLGDTPTSLEEAMRFDDPERQLQHNAGPSAASGKEAGYHGHGGGEEFEEKNILRFFQRLDEGLRDRIQPNSPLVLAGVQRLLPIYQRANEHPTLLEDGVEGNPEQWDAEQLRAKAQPIIESYLGKEAQEAKNRYADALGSDLSTQDLKEIVPKAYSGQVDTLLVAQGARTWGNYDLEQNQVSINGGGQDLINFAARHTLLKDGRVFLLDEDQMPEGETTCALLRY